MSVLYLILALPVLASFYYSSVPSLTWLAGALASLAAALWLMKTVLAQISNVIAKLALLALLVLMIAIFQLSRLLSYYFQGEGFNARFFFHFNPSTVFTIGDAYLPLILLSILYLISVLTVSLLYLRRAQHQPRRPFKTMALISVAVTVMLVEPELSAFAKQSLRDTTITHEPRSLDQIDWQDLGLDQGALSGDVGRALPGKNLVLIYLEGMEQIYSEGSVFPGLTPNLDRLSSEGLEFTGLNQTDGTGWTVAGMLASQCGTPLLAPLRAPSHNEILVNGFLDRAVCLGDILSKAGYRQIFLGGASAAFAGKGSFLASHGYDEVHGREELVSSLDDPAYVRKLGLFDDSLFKIAIERYDQLAKTGRPFNLTMLTLDTHHQGTGASGSCPGYPYLDNPMLDAVHCTDFLVGQFIDEIAADPAWSKTLVVLVSDHLAMRNPAEQYYPEDYERRLRLLVLNSGRVGRVDRTGSHMDIAPTLLELMGVEHGQRFLAGSSLVGMPGTTWRLSEPVARRRSSAIEYINSNVLTSQSHGVCDGDQLVAIRNDQLYIGSQEVKLSRAGYPRSPEILLSGYAALALIKPSGRIDLMMTLQAENLPHVLHQYAGEIFLLVAATADLPTIPGVKIGSETISVLLGNLEAKTLYLGGAARVEDIHIDGAQCSNWLNVVQAVKPASPINLFDSICRVQSAGWSRLDAGGTRLHLERVSYGAAENRWLSAILTRREQGVFILTEQQRLNKVPELGNSDRCHAYFGNSELIIPGLWDRNGQPLRMKQIPARPGEFAVVEDL